MPNANRFLLAVIGSFLVACPPMPQPTPAPGPDATDAAPAPAPDPASDPSDNDEAGVSRTPCGRACSNMKRFGCIEAKPTPNGTTCAALCTRIATFPGMRLDTACVVAAQTKDALRLCGVCR